MITTVLVVVHHHYINTFIALDEMAGNVALKVDLTANQCKMCGSICEANTRRKCPEEDKHWSAFTYCSILGLVLTSPSTVMSEKSILNLLSSVAILHGGERRALGFNLQTAI